MKSNKGRERKRGSDKELENSEGKRKAEVRKRERLRESMTEKR